MRRRAGSLGLAPPERLLRLVPSEWPGVDAWESWRAARLLYATEHPDGALGDVVDVIREHARLLRGR